MVAKRLIFHFSKLIWGDSVAEQSVLLVSSYHRSSREKRPDDIFYRFLVFFKFVAFNDREVLQR